VSGNDRSRTPRQFVLGAAADAGEDAAAVEGELLVDAVLANQLRSQPRNAGATNPGNGGSVMANRECIALTDQERAERRKREQQLTEQAVAQLRSSAG
jgi:hypothetical protein